MKSKVLKSVLFVSLFIVSASCFVYVNSASAERILPTASIEKPTKSDDETNSKMLDLQVVKGVLTLFHRFLPAK